MTTIKDKFCIAVNGGEYDVGLDCRLDNGELSDFRIVTIDGDAPKVDQYLLIDALMDRLEGGVFDKKIINGFQQRSFQATHVHVASGRRYRVESTAIMQDEDASLDMADVVIYIGEDGGRWVRRLSEFNDGRFRAI